MWQKFVLFVYENEKQNGVENEFCNITNVTGFNDSKYLYIFKRNKKKTTWIPLDDLFVYSNLKLVYT